ncbi:MAG: hypothetical protein ACRCZ9_01620 [Fusobacteriaceae bacterium]
MKFELVNIEKNFLRETISKEVEKNKIAYIKKIIESILINEEYYEKMLTEISEQLILSYEKAYYSSNGESSPLKRLLYSEKKTDFEIKRTFKSRLLPEISENNVVVYLEILENRDVQEDTLNFIIKEMGEHLTASLKNNIDSVNETIKEIAEIIVSEINDNLTKMLKNKDLEGKDDEIIKALLFSVFGPEMIYLKKEFIEGIGK